VVGLIPHDRDAQSWYYILERDAGRPTWDNFRLLCHQRFGPALSTNHLADLARLPFTSSDDAYMSAFQAHLAHAGRLDPLQQAQLFTGGLPKHIRVDVELHEPSDLHRAMRLAWAFERRERRQSPCAAGREPTSLTPHHVRAAWELINYVHAARSVVQPTLPLLDAHGDGRAAQAGSML
jgi:hypothetical protein